MNWPGKLFPEKASGGYLHRADDTGQAGVLENRQATVWSNSMDKSAVKIPPGERGSLPRKTDN
jgi:hypothetical protein